jgi:7-keto-8-aminopelargonate synthetase-like enzyme
VLRALQPTGPTTAELDGQRIVVACSNDYLGLAWANRDLASRGGGSGASRLISGSRPIHHELEDALEALFDRPALLFNSGYQANLAVFSTVCEAGQTIASDALNHASIIDGLRLSRSARRVVPHAQPASIPADADAIAVEGLFSMDGDIPPLTTYPSAPLLLVDEAHAVGAMGPEGRGAAAEMGVCPDALIGTFGKAYGASGAFVIGPPSLKALLINAGRSFIFSTALPEPTARLALAGLRGADPALRDALATNTRRLRSGLEQLGWSLRGQHHIVPVVAGPASMALAARLLKQGVFAPGIRFPTVPAGQERVRLTTSAAHTDDQIDQILDAFGPKDSLG